MRRPATPLTRRRLRLARRAAALVLLAAIAAPSPAHAQDDRQLIAERLLAQGPQGILVSVDGSFERVRTAARDVLASRACNCTIARLPDFAAVKQRALCGVPDFVVTGDASFLEAVNARVNSVTGLEALLARPDVIAVYLDEPIPLPGTPFVPPLEPLAPAQAASLAFPFEEGALFSCAFAPGRTAATWLRGDWNGDGIEDVGKYDPALDAFLLDANGNGLWDGAPGGDLRIAFAPGRGAGEPLVGDWNGDGRDGIGKRVSGRAYLDADEDGVWRGAGQGDLQSWVGEELVVGDWNGDGADQLGKYVRPTRRFPIGSFPPELDRFVLDDGDGSWENPPQDRYVIVASSPLCPGRPVAFDWDPAHPGDGVGKIWGRSPGPEFGYAVDLDENGLWAGNSGGDLLRLGQRVEYCGPLPELF